MSRRSPRSSRCEGRAGPCAWSRSTVATARGRRRDRLATEEPLEIRASGPGSPPCASPSRCARRATTSSWPPGSCFTEGLIAGRGDDPAIRYCTDGRDRAAAQRRRPSTLRAARSMPSRTPRATSSRRSALRRVRQGVDRRARRRVRAVPRRRPSSRATIVRRCRTRCAAQQRVFDRTGGLHAAGAVRRRRRAARRSARTSAATTRSTSSSATALLAGGCRSPAAWLVVSGRSSFELVQKARRRASRSCARSRRRRRSRSRRPGGSASRWSGSCAGSASTSTRTRSASNSDEPRRCCSRLRRSASQHYLFEARQLQALSFAVHIPLVCFGIAFPALVVFCEWLGRRTGDRDLPDARAALVEGDGRAVRRRRRDRNDPELRARHPVAGVHGAVRRGVRPRRSRSRGSRSSSRRSSSASTSTAGIACRRGCTCSRACRSSSPASPAR